jgi:hypothetical protein
VGDFRARTRRFWADFGLTEWQKAKRDGREPPPEPPHHYRTCRDEFCPEEACQAHREGREDEADLDD